MKGNEIRAKREARLAGFAKSHFIISGTGFCVLLPLYAILSCIDLWQYTSLLVLVTGLLLLVYIPAGVRCARKKQWGSFDSWKEGLWAFLDPALIAWGWAAIVVLSLFLNVWPLLLFLFCASLFLAAPSSLLVLLAMSSDLDGFGRLVGLGWLGFCLLALLAGGIPPLLFFLGSLLGGKRIAANELSAENRSVI